MKKQRFKQLQGKNYRASLRLEGIHLKSDESESNDSVLTEVEHIKKLKGQYAR
ncbi:YhfG family protein [Photobacterium sp. ZSDE20]|uniref:YhfG family protein n=1 Tax=Photobacterium pectinilyticum TaxID=2906793 RepID=A0ABT1MZL5_9GAMM|nr:YhfG family protein [Photobacterium sp. ZSDE20]MCQ1056936.1 YhfG family protein [Photobacterium sp. ZSDE20]MDD1821071.1 YhfG family protein [Photobacterium sp. ZSDE20]